MLTDNDKKWFTAVISGRVSSGGDVIGTALSAYERRISARLERFQARLTRGFRSSVLPPIDPRIEAAALRTFDLEMEALQSRVDKLEKH
jgi:hypothetical protein